MWSGFCTNTFPVKVSGKHQGSICYRSNINFSKDSYHEEETLYIDEVWISCFWERESENKQLLQGNNIFFGRLTPQIADKYFLSVLIHLCQLIFFTHMVFVKKIHTFLLSWESGKEKYLQGSLSVVSHPIVACSKTFSQWIELIWVSISQGYPIGVVVFRFEKPWSCDLVSWSQWSPTLPSPVLNTKTFMAALTLGHNIEYVR